MSMLLPFLFRLTRYSKPVIIWGRGAEQGGELLYVRTKKFYFQNNGIFEPCYDIGILQNTSHCAKIRIFNLIFST